VTSPSTESASGGYRRVWIDHTSELATSAESVHALLLDIDNWPQWTPGLNAIRRNKQQAFAPGCKFAMIVQPKGAPPTYVPCVVTSVTPGLIEWGGGIGRSVVRHRFEIEALGPSRCRVRQLEFATGILAVLARPIERFVYAHDLAWSKALEQRFGN
jgi:hypothetical protein